MTVFEIFLDRFDELVGKITILTEILAVGEIYDADFGVLRGSFGFLVDGGNGVKLFREIIVCDERSGGAKNAVNVEGFSNKTG